MRKFGQLLILGALSALIIGAPAQAQELQTQPIPPAPVPASPGLAPAPRGRFYNPAATELVRGTVVALKRVNPKKAGRPVRLVLTLQTDTGPAQVFLGPAAYVESQNFILNPGDPVEVTGVRVGRARRTVFIAAEVRSGSQVLRLRDQQGRPLWAQGGGRGRY